MQTSKSFIKTGKEARDEIDGITQVIDGLQEETKSELESILDVDINYVTPAAIEKYLEDQEDFIEVGTVGRAFSKHFLESQNFNKTLFHYCINRLGAVKDQVALDYCISCISERPEELSHILPYFSKLVHLKQEIAERVIHEFEPQRFLLDHTHFLFLRWIFKEGLTSQVILTHCRSILRNRQIDKHVRHYAWALLGESGDSSDLDAIESEYSEAGHESSKATILYSIRRMVDTRRNSIYSRAESDGHLVGFSVKTAKEKHG